jgi:hypothetical protein
MSGPGASAGRKHHVAGHQAAGGSQRDTVQGKRDDAAAAAAESSASTVLERSFIEELPLNGRRYTDFTVLTPNTSYDGDTGLVSIAGQQGGEDSGYANGNGSNAFTVDGTNATNNYFADIMGRYRIPYLYGEDAIQEFQVSVSPTRPSMEVERASSMR